MILALLQRLWLLSYITNNNSFPKPLTAAEEREMLARFADGDIDARNILIEHNLRLVAHIVKKYSNHLKDAEDFISVGTIGLIKAISTYNSGKGTKLATYAARCIDNVIWFCVTRITPFGRCCKIYRYFASF